MSYNVLCIIIYINTIHISSIYQYNVYAYFLVVFRCAVAGLVWPRGGGRRLRRLCHSCHGSAGVVATRALRLHGAHRGGSPWRNDSDWKTYWLDGILTHLFASIYIDIYTPTLVKPIHTHIYIYMHIWTYFHILVFCIYIYAMVKFHGLAECFPSYRSWWRNELLKQSERYFSVDCRNCSGLGLKK